MGHSSLSGNLNQFFWNAGMLDLGFSGNPYTWSNGREGRGLIMERLDRGIANGEWRGLFPRATVQHIARVASDHALILLDTYGDQDRNPRPFHFEAFWATDVRCKEVVAKARRYEGSVSPAYTFCQHLKATKVALRRWNKEVFGHIQSNIQSLQVELDNLQQHYGVGSSEPWLSLKEKAISSCLLEEQRKEEVFWRQKSPYDMVANARPHTSFFHLSTINR